MASEAERLRAQAARCLRLSKEVLPDDPVRSLLQAMAAESLEKAQALEQAADQQQQHQQVGNVVPPPPEPSHGVAHQQQQQQPQIPPDKSDDSE